MNRIKRRSRGQSKAAIKTLTTKSRASEQAIPASNGHAAEDPTVKLLAKVAELRKKLGRDPSSREINEQLCEFGEEQAARKLIERFRNRNRKLDEPEDEGIQALLWARAGRMLLREVQGLNPDPVIKNLSEFKQPPKLRQPIINGLLRRGETANLVSDPKVGKSWTVYGLALSVSQGRSWLGQLACRAGSVLIVDYELDEDLLRHRLETVATAMNVRKADYEPKIGILSLRGRLPFDIRELAQLLETRAGNKRDLVVLDAMYRALPADVSESDHTKLTALYNLIDTLAATLDCAWINIHHASKGNQSEKSITDVGSGAGVQSRAVDAHIIIRPHQEEDCFVLEAAVRSFPPLKPIGLRWDFPLWKTDTKLNTVELQTVGSKQQKAKDAQGMKDIVAALEKKNTTIRKLCEATGFGHGRIERLISQLIKEGTVRKRDAAPDKGRPATTYKLSPASEPPV